MKKNIAFIFASFLGASILVDAQSGIIERGISQISSNIKFLPTNTLDIGNSAQTANPAHVYSQALITNNASFSGVLIGSSSFNANDRTELNLHVADGVAQFTNNAQTGFTRLIGGTNDGTSNGWSVLRTGSNLETWTGDGTSARLGVKASNLLLTGPIQSVNNIATVGNFGVPTIVAQNRLTGQTGAIASVATFTPTADGTFEISADVLITASTSFSFTVTVNYTDEGGTARTQQLAFNQSNGGGFVTSFSNTAGALSYTGYAITLRDKANSAITIVTSGTFTTVTYNVEGSIRQIG